MFFAAAICVDKHYKVYKLFNLIDNFSLDVDTYLSGLLVFYMVTHIRRRRAVP